MKSVMNHNFSQVPAADIQRSVFDRSHGHKTTFNSGDLIPFFVDEILPGDTLSLRATIFARLATLIHPIMDNVFLDTFFFFVPNRLLWNNWERMNGAQDDPEDSIDFTVPNVWKDDGDLIFDAGGMADYFGLPTEVTIGSADYPNALPFRAYNLIWNEWFRDQNLQNSLTVTKTDGPDDMDLYAIQKRGKRHDYFTSCLPWPQKGDSVSLPLGSTAPVIGNGETLGLWNGATQFGMVYSNGTGFNGFLRASDGNENTPVGSAVAGAPPTGELSIGVSAVAGNSGMIADLSAATAATINELRLAFQMQKVLERDARGGTRYVELLKSHFRVTSPDFRLQRPEYLGGHSQRVDVKAIPQTSQSEITGTPQATLSAYANVGSNSGFNKSFVEHGYVIGLVNVRSDITYQEGMNRLWSRRTRYDFYLPALAHLGEQAVLNKEIYYPTMGTNANAVFGYQERWAEYRYKPSMVTGIFRSNHGSSLDAWHLATEFGAIPPLNAAFIEDAPPLERVIAVVGGGEAENPEVLMDSYISMKHARPMPIYSVPGQIDRF